MHESLIIKHIVPAFKSLSTREDTDKFFRMIYNLKIPREIMLFEYKSIIQIAEDEMGELCDYAKNILPEGNQEELEKVAKIIHTIAFYL